MDVVGLARRIIRGMLVFGDGGRYEGGMTAMTGLGDGGRNADCFNIIGDDECNPSRDRETAVKFVSDWRIWSPPSESRDRVNDPGAGIPKDGGVDVRLSRERLIGPGIPDRDCRPGVVGMAGRADGVRSPVGGFTGDEGALGESANPNFAACTKMP
jgi:hypothetical protein